MNIDLMMFEADKVTIFVPELLKQSRPGHHLDPMVLLRYPDQEICVVSHLEQYTEKTKDFRKDQNLLISFVKPHTCITTSTNSMVRNSFEECGCGHNCIWVTVNQISIDSTL